MSLWNYLKYQIGSWAMGHPLGASEQLPVNLLDIREYAGWALDVYSDSHTLRAKYGSSIQAEGFPRTSLRAFVLPQATRTVVAVRGTANLRNALYDMDIREDSRHFHHGFDVGMRDVFPWLDSRLHHYDRPIVLTGHSLGGAIAALLLYTLRQKGYNVAQAVTFGQPKITDSSEGFQALPLLRVVHEGDPVPFLPPLSSYQHFGTELILENSGNAWFMEEHRAERKEVSSLWTNLAHVHPLHHKMDSYIEVLDRAIRVKSAAGLL